MYLTPGARSSTFSTIRYAKNDEIEENLGEIKSGPAGEFSARVLTRPERNFFRTQSSSYYE